MVDVPHYIGDQCAPFKSKESVVPHFLEISVPIYIDGVHPLHWRLVCPIALVVSVGPPYISAQCSLITLPDSVLPLQWLSMCPLYICLPHYICHQCTFNTLVVSVPT